MGEEEGIEVRFTLPVNFDPEKEREITKSLLKCSENVEQQLLHPPVPILYNSWVDVLGGWVIEPSKTVERVPKKRKTKKPIPVNENKTDIQGDYRNSNYNDFSNSGNLTSRSDEDVWPGYVPDWKAGVEAHTYRYVPNNGKYRARKFAKSYGGPPTKIQRHVYDRPVVLSMEQKVLQKEIQRDLRREFEQYEMQKIKTTVEQKESSTNNVDSGRTKKGLSPVTKDLKFQRPGSPRSKSASDSDTPAIYLPMMGKTVSENFIDKFTTKISIFEEEVRSDLKKFNKKSGNSDGDKIDNTGFRLGRLKSDKSKYSGKTPQKTEQLAQETFSVRQIYNSDKSFKHGRSKDLQQEANIGAVAGANNARHQLHNRFMGDMITVPLSNISSPETPQGAGYEEISPWYEKERMWMRDFDNGRPNSNHIPDTKLLEGSLTATRYCVGVGPRGDTGGSSNNSSADSKRKTTNAPGYSSTKSVTNSSEKRNTKHNRSKQKQPTKSGIKEEAKGVILDTDDSSTKFILNGFHAAPLGILKDREMTLSDKPDTLNNPFKGNILPQISGKRIEVPVGSNKVM
ncbi:uncharacterized protein LOC106182112 [Lingula anatina]|uniref:Uncharacterized protein LOC106182112 n=1 Tax=Lingula anatina TaxID=7574 RepID=A0A1S3KJ26_LINAN|nr:uncharacterized protein LOC106182112 [Lingula anatina]|eukprot:XP_013422216.1 uncharacterized protein LOC106182112 [Lingula anatina]